MTNVEHLQKLVYLLQEEYLKKGEKLTQVQIAESSDKIDQTKLNRLLKGRIKTETTAELYLAEINRVFGVALFKNKGKLTLKKLDNYTDIQEKNKTSYYYVYYYILNLDSKIFKIAKAKLYINKKKKIAHLTFYSRKDSSFTDIKQGKVYEVNDQLVCIFSSNFSARKKTKPSMNYFMLQLVH